jgi:hypothetical protein
MNSFICGNIENSITTHIELILDLWICNYSHLHSNNLLVIYDNIYIYNHS